MADNKSLKKCGGIKLYYTNKNKLLHYFIKTQLKVGKGSTGPEETYIYLIPFPSIVYLNGLISIKALAFGVNVGLFIGYGIPYLITTNIGYLKKHEKVT